jgi:carotenoid cleavage dioxygenase-like enzyme
MHDTAITENYLVLIDTSLRVNPQRFFEGKRSNFVHFEPEVPCRFGLVERNDIKAGEAKAVWFTLEDDVNRNGIGHIFHVMNSWEGNDIIYFFFFCV